MKNILKNFIPDYIYLCYKYYCTFGKKINLKNPQTFNEKLQWLKLYNRKPLYTILVDKYAVKEYVANKIGKEYIIPTLGIYNSVKEIDFDKLPNQFVLKATHDSNSTIICKDKNIFNKQEAKEKLNKTLKNNFYYIGREYPYKNVPRRIIAEQYMKDNKTKELRDYKFFCFNGKPIYCQVISDRTTNECIDFFDMNWNHQPFTGLVKNFPNCSTKPQKPNSFEQMKNACKILSKDIPFIRADFYEINNKMYFGELTFYPANGFGKFYPEEWNTKIGNLLILPPKKQKI